MRPLVFITLATSMITIPQVYGADTAKQYDFLLTGMDDPRQRLRTGLYRASGRFISESKKVGRLDGSVRIFSAFDYDAEKFRFDRTEPTREGNAAPPDSKGRPNWKPKIIGGQLIRLKDRAISHNDDSFSVRIGTTSPDVDSLVKFGGGHCPAACAFVPYCRVI